MKDVIVIGAGASGLMAACVAAERGNRVIVLEKNEKAGKKIYITGKGRCNVTNAIQPADFLNNIVTNAKFLTGCIYKFSPEMLMRRLEEGGLRLKTERGNRVFPESDKASDVTRCLQTQCERAGGEFRFNENVVSIEKDEQIFHVSTQSEKFEADAVILCTGGVSYPATGSTGDGYRFAEKFGHTVHALRPALCGIVCNMQGLSGLQGLSLKNVRVSAVKGEKSFADFFGEMLFTHFGVSGPVILSLSSILSKSDLRDIHLSIDMKPALDADTLDKRLLREFDANKNRQLLNIMPALLPKSLIDPVLAQCGVPEAIRANAVTKKQREMLIRALKDFRLLPLSLRPIEESIVTAGGVDVREVDPKTMESKLVPGLFLCGEVLDVDALTGGFNLQIAFSTGYAAGNSI